MDKKQWDDFVERLRFYNRGDGVKDHITAHPLFAVEKKVRVYGFDSDYSSTSVWIRRSDDGAEYETVAEFLDDLDEEQVAGLNKSITKCSMGDYTNIKEAPEEDQLEAINMLGYELERVYFNEHWEVVNAHFTKEGAEAFIARKKHDYSGGMRVYVKSQYLCNEFNAVVGAILDGEIGFVEAKECNA